MKVSREEYEGFVKVCQHYRTPESEMLEIREAANRDPEAWRESFKTMLEEIDAR